MVLYLETKLEELEDTMKQDCEKISSLQNIVRTVEQRNLLGDRPVVGISGNNIDVANSANGAQRRSGLRVLRLRELSTCSSTIRQPVSR